MSRENLKYLAKEQLRGRWFIAIVASIFCALFTNTTVWEKVIPLRDGSALAITIPLVSLLLGGTFTVGLCKFALNFADKEKEANFNDVFSAFPIYFKTLGLNILSAIIIVLGTLLLIVPGIIAGLALSQACYILADNPDRGVIECMEDSVQIMKGHKWEFFVLGLSFLGWIIVCILTLGIGFLWLEPYMLMTNTNFYLSVKNEERIL